MKFLPYLEEVVPYNLDDSNIQSKIDNSKLKGRLDRYGLLKLEYKSWFSSAFRPVAICSSDSNSSTNQLKVTYRPNLMGTLFIGYVLFFLFSELLDALFNGVFIGVAALCLFMILTYCMLLVSFWLEVPKLKREIYRLFE
ncbi:hypothetical protein MACH09_10590 [Vibrio sp. MACH09]|nr:hypothetical protein MACH09_10590 [Vibrio sp. MACH09]